MKNFYSNTYKSIKMSDNDLPLLSNINEIRARHYLIDLKPSFHNHVFYGRVIIFFETTISCEKKGKSCMRKCFCQSTNKETSELAPSKSDHKKKSQNCCGREIKVNSAASVGEDFIDRISANITRDNFDLILDCCDLKVNSVCEVSCSAHEISEFLCPYFIRNCQSEFITWCNKRHLPLQFSVDQWSLKICKPGVTDVQNFPQVICIEYETIPEGKSLLWRSDQNGNLCVFTAAASINNRSLLPYQDPPSAMSTWQSWITVPEGYYVSMTGDELPFKNYVREIFENKSMSHDLSSTDDLSVNSVNDLKVVNEDHSKSNSVICFYYYTTMVLPIATIAIAIGKWEMKHISTPSLQLESEKNVRKWKTCGSSKLLCKHYEYPCHLNSDVWNSNTQLSMVYAPAVKELVKPLSNFVPHAVEAAVSLLGTYPCQRLEIVILPLCFGSLGLASPNLIFLSPTLAIDDPAALIRLAHEISHAWFGINIGAQDWTEEWISEGFATYMEDSIYMEALLAYQLSQNSAALSAPGIHNSSSDLQLDNRDVLIEEIPKQYSSNLNRQQLEDLSDLRAHLRYRTLLSELENSSQDLQTLRPMQGESLVADGVSFVKDGLNPEKTFLQVHYLKGYFLLKFLSKMVGRNTFDVLLKAYVTHYHGQLVLTQDILTFFINTCPKILSQGITLENLYGTWFHKPGLNDLIQEMYGTVSNKLVSVVQQHYQYWTYYNKKVPNKSLNKKIKIELSELHFPDQLVLLLEYLLELPKLQSRVLNAIYKHYDIKTKNADVRHRWCELVIKHNFPDLTEVERFLVNDQSMGVYLYGELIISRKPKHKHLAEKVFTSTMKDMDDNTRLTVHSMLFGN